MVLMKILSKLLLSRSACLIGMPTKHPTQQPNASELTLMHAQTGNYMESLLPPISFGRQARTRWLETAQSCPICKAENSLSGEAVKIFIIENLFT